MLKNPFVRSIAIFAIAVCAFIVYWQSGLAQMADVEYVRGLTASPLAALLVILSMAGAWAFALPASVFFFIVPIFFHPATAVIILIVSTSLGAVVGYRVVQLIAAPWAERVRQHRVTALLSRNANWANLFALRVVPSSPHGMMNYGAGLLEVPLPRFLSATAAAISVKAILYVQAVSSAAEATSIREALDAGTIIALFGIALLAVVGRLVSKRLVALSDNDGGGGPS